MSSLLQIQKKRRSSTLISIWKSVFENADHQSVSLYEKKEIYNGAGFVLVLKQFSKEGLIAKWGKYI